MIRKLGYFFTITMCLIGCRDDDANFLLQKRFPIIRTAPATDLNDKGVTLNGQVLKLGTEEKIQEAGFVIWYDNNKLPEYKIIKDPINNFHLRLSTDLILDKEYFYFAYCKTPNFELQGEPESFISKGVASPSITSISPLEATDLDQITITGQNFNSDNGVNSVNLVNGQMSIKCNPLNSSNSKLVFVIPPNPYQGKFQVQITTPSGSFISTNEFSLLGPNMTSIEPKSAKAGEIVSIYGNNMTVSGFKLFLDNEQFFDFSSTSSTKIDIIMPRLDLEVHSKLLEVKLIVGQKEATALDKIELLQTWFKKTSMPVYNSSSTYIPTFVYDGKVYQVDEGPKLIHEYSPNTDSWVITEVSNDSTFPSFATFFWIDNELFFTAYKGFSQTKIGKVEKIGANWKFTDLKNINYYYSPLATFVSEGSVFLTGFKRDFNKVIKFTPSSNTIKVMKDHPEHIKHGRVFTLKNEVYSIGLDQIWKYDNQLDSWISVSSFGAAELGFGQAYIFNETCYYVVRSNFYEIRPEENYYKSITRPNFGYGDNFYGFRINNRCFLGGIHSNNSKSSILYEFSP